MDLQKYIRVSVRNEMLLHMLEFTLMNLSPAFLFKAHQGKAE